MFFAGCQIDLKNASMVSDIIAARFTRGKLKGFVLLCMANTHKHCPS